MPFDELLALAGISAVVVAAVAWGADRRRLRRADLDRVGWMPWTMLFFWALLSAIMLVGLAFKAHFAVP